MVTNIISSLHNANVGWNNSFRHRLYFVAAGEKVSDRYNIFVMWYDSHN